VSGPVKVRGSTVRGSSFPFTAPSPLHPNCFCPAVCVRSPVFRTRQGAQMSKNDGFKVTRRDDGELTMVYPQGVPRRAYGARVRVRSCRRRSTPGRVRSSSTARTSTTSRAPASASSWAASSRFATSAATSRSRTSCRRSTHVFELLGFHQLYDLTETEEEAVGKFSH
jgi:hypothetical protein